MTRHACQIILVFLAGVLPAAAQSLPDGRDPVHTARELVASVVTAKSSSGRYLAAGRNRISVYDFVRWVEDLGERYSTVTDLTLPRTRSPLIRVYFTEDDSGSAEIAVTARPEKGAFTHSVAVHNYDSEEVEDLMETLSYCLTATAVHAMRAEADGRSAPAGVPVWLTQGIAQNLYPGARKRNSEKMLARWKRGEMVSLQEVIASEQEDSDEALRMTRGMFVGWLLSFGRDAALIEGICKTLSRGVDVGSEELATLLKGAGVEDPGYSWDVWMVRQDRTVYLPGGTSLKDLEWLKGQLLLYPEEFGIPLTEELPERLTLDQLVEFKRNDALREALKTRFVAMQLKAAGKSQEFRNVVSAYCKFLDGVIDQKMDWRLRRYLQNARTEQRNFEIRTLSARLKEKSALEREREKNEEDE